MPAIAATYSDHSNDYYDRREKIDYDDGESGISTAMAKNICGETYRHQYDSYTGQDEVIHYDVDLNFDGVFDEKDDEVSYPFEFAVMVGAQT